MSSANMGSLFISNVYALYFLLLTVVLARTFSIRSNKCCKNGHPCSVPNSLFYH